MANRGVAARDDAPASGFRDVDGAADFAAFSGYPTQVESLPFFVKCKHESFERFGASPGRRILDVGGGLGDDAAVLVNLVVSGVRSSASTAVGR